MSLKEFLSTLDQLEGDARAAFDSATQTEELEQARVRFLAPKTALSKRSASKWAASIPVIERMPAFG